VPSTPQGSFPNQTMFLDFLVDSFLSRKTKKMIDFFFFISPKKKDGSFSKSTEPPPSEGLIASQKQRFCVEKDINEKMREIVSIQVGGCGNAIGIGFWDKMCTEHSINKGIKQETTKSDFVDDIFFSSSSTGEIFFNKY
jgi:hypothetical protein